MYDNWIYLHFINTPYFAFVCVSILLVIGVSFLYSFVKDLKNENSV